jgi:hypothetical protein
MDEMAASPGADPPRNPYRAQGRLDFGVRALDELREGFQVDDLDFLIRRHEAAVRQRVEQEAANQRAIIWDEGEKAGIQRGHAGGRASGERAAWSSVEGAFGNVIHHLHKMAQLFAGASNDERGED